MIRILGTLVLAATLTSAQAATTDFFLTGRTGDGLLPGNENHTINGNPGSGGEVGAGISFDDATRILTINIGWGSGNGFTDLTGTANAGHIHGPTLSGGTAAYFQDANVRYGLNTLPGWNGSASSGGFNGSVTIAAGDVAGLFNGQFYINAHTSLNPGGEIRGQLVPVPEPSTMALIGLGTMGLLLLARRRRQ